MDVKISINGILFQMPEIELKDDWCECVNCEKCFLNPRTCSNVCTRYFIEKVKREYKQ